MKIGVLPATRSKQTLSLCTTRDAIVDVDVVVVGREVPRTVVPDHAQREVMRLLGCERLSTVERGDTLHVYRYPAADEMWEVVV